ncbi:hypothetical protein OC834_007458 [Tilletia horrida]|nr:hypothetical protein OC834_007458 [Tilletia horrida]
MPKAEQDALAKILRRFNLGVNEFLSEQGLKSAASTHSTRTSDTPSTSRDTAAQGSAAYGTGTLGAVAPTHPVTVSTSAAQHVSRQPDNDRGGQSRVLGEY